MSGAVCHSDSIATLKFSRDLIQPSSPSLLLVAVGREAMRLTVSIQPQRKMVKMLCSVKEVPAAGSKL